MKTPLSLVTLAVFALASSSAEACRCAVLPTSDVIAKSDAIVSGSVIWSHFDGKNSYAAVRFDRLIQVSKRVSPITEAALAAQVKEGQIGFFRGRISDRRTSCPGSNVAEPENTRLAYVTYLDEEGALSIEGGPINYCELYQTFAPASSRLYVELVKILGDLR